MGKLIKTGFFFIYVISVTVSWAQFIDPSTSQQPETTEDNINVDIARGIRVEIIDASQNTVRVSWVPSGINDEFIIARNTVPISNRDLLLASKSIGRVPAGSSNYIDSGLAPGTYFYAVASKDQIRNGRIFLYAGENFTSQGVTINSATVSANLPAQVSLIFAQLIGESDVRISWRGISSPGITYNVYRSNEPLDTTLQVRRAQKIAAISNGATFYVDKDLPGPGIYYYGVTTMNRNGAEDTRLVPDQSYTRNGIRFAVVDLPVTRFIKATRKRENDVTLEWKDISDAQSQQYSYIIYRADQPIRSPGDLARARRIAVARPGTEFLLDRGLSKGVYYYAISTQNSTGQLSNRFIAGQNATLKAIEVGQAESRPDNNQYNFQRDEFAGEKLFSDLAAFHRKNLVLLSWKNSLVVRDAEKVKVHLYRFEKKPQSLRDLVDGTIIAKLGTEQVLYEEVPPKAGIYYYAVFLDTRQGIKPEVFAKDENFIGPISFKTENEAPDREEPGLNGKPKKKKKVVQSSQINNVIRNTYLKGRYLSAVEALQPYRQAQSIRDRAKARFYLGLSNYRLRKYDAALEFFIDPLVMRAYGKRAKFWYRRTIEKVK